jgi:hypothetical protein
MHTYKERTTGSWVDEVSARTKESHARALSSRLWVRSVFIPTPALLRTLTHAHTHTHTGPSCVYHMVLRRFKS